MQKIIYLIIFFTLSFSMGIGANPNTKVDNSIKEKIEKSKPSPIKINYVGSRKKERKSVAGFFTVFGNTDVEILDGDPPSTDLGTDFGKVEVGTSVEFFFTIVNDGTAVENLTVFVLDLILGDPNFTIGVNPLEGGTIGLGTIDLMPGEEVGFSIIFQPNAVGVFNEAIKFETSDDFAIEFFIDLAGEGVITPPPPPVDPCAGVTVRTFIFNRICPGSPLNLQETSGVAADSYSWTGPNGFSSSLKNPTIPNVTAAANGTYTLTIKKGACTLSDNFNLTIEFLPKPNIAFTGEASICNGEDIRITDNGTGARFWSWTGPGNFTSGSRSILIQNATAANSGDYILTVTSNDNCKTTETFSIEVKAKEAIDILLVEEPCSGNAIDLSTTQTTIGINNWDWIGPNGFSSDESSPNIPNSSDVNAGNYAVTVTFSTGCTATSSQNIAIKTSPEIDIQSNNPSCEGETFNLSQVGEDGNHNWTGPDGFTSERQFITIPDITAAQAGTYSLVLTADNGCTVSGNIDIELATQPQPDLSYSGPFCAGESELKLRDNASGSVAYIWVNQNTGEDYEGKIVFISNPQESDAGIYKVTVTSTEGCTAEEEIEIVYNGVAPRLNIFGEEEICQGETIRLFENRGEGMNYQWTGPNDFESNTKNISIENAGITESGIYKVVADNGNDCIAETEFEVLVNPTPSIVLSITENEPCEGDATTFEEKGGDLTNWNWTGPDNFQSSLQNPIINNLELTASGTYTLTGMNAAGCPSESSLELTVLPSFNAGTGTNTSVCAGTVIDLNTLLSNQQGGGVFIDMDGTGSLNGATLETSTLKAGDYTFVYTLAESSKCVSKVEITITVQEALSAGLDADLTQCQGSLVNLTSTLSGADAGGVFIDNGNSGALRGSFFDANNIDPGTYDIIYRVGGGLCPVDEATILVNVAALPEVPQFSSVVYCGGGALILSATEGDTYEWSTGGATKEIGVSPLESTTYSVTVTNMNICSVTAQATVQVGTITNLEITNNSSICKGEPLQLNISGADTYTWSPTTGLSDPNSNSPTASPEINTTYEVKASNILGCTALREVSISVNDLPQVEVSAAASFCVGDGATLQASGAATYQWSPTIGLDNPTSNTPFANPQESTVYSVVATNENGCTASNEIATEVLALPNINLAQNQTVCEGNPLELMAAGGGTYLWEATEGITDLTSANQTLMPTQETSYKVKVTGENGCVAEAETTVSISPNPIADAGLNQTACVGEGVELTAIGGINYQWSNNTATAIINVSPLENTTYTVTVTNAEGCTDTDEVLIEIREGFDVAVSSDTFFCLGGNAQLNASGGATYSWTPATGINDINSPNPIVNPTTTTIYKVEIKDDSGCLVEREITIEVKEVENFSLTQNQDICEGSSVNLVATGGGTYIWSPADAFNNPMLSSQELNPTNPINIYKVEVTDEFGCKATDSVLVNVQPIPVVNALPVTPVCEGENINLVGSGNEVTTWKWVGPNFENNNQNPEIAAIQINQAGTYALTGTTEFGCSSTAMITIAVNARPKINIDAPNLLCEGEELVFKENGGATLSEWEWSSTNGDTFSGAAWDLGMAQPSFSGTYTLKVTDANACTNTTEKEIKINTAPNAGLDIDLTYCQGEVVDLVTQLSGGDSGGIFEPSPELMLSGTILNTQNLSEGNYTVSYKVVIDGCPSDEAIIAIRVDEPKNAGLDNFKQFCQGEKVELKDLLQQASEGGVFTETSNSGALNGSLFNTQMLQAATYAIEYTVGMGSTCGEDKSLINIELSEQVKAGDDITTDMCQVGTFDLATLLVDATDGGIFADLSQSNALNGSILTAENLPVGQYIFEYQLQSNNQCPSDSVRLEINVKEELTAGTDNQKDFCSGTDIELSTLLVDADAGGVFMPIGTPPPTFSGNSFSTDGIDANNYVFEYKVGGTVGCPESTAMISVNLQKSPALQLIVSDTFFCLGDSVILEAIATGGTGDLNLQWITPSGNSTANNIIATEAGSFQVNVTDANNCEAMATTFIRSNQELIPTIDGKSELCEGEELLLQSTLNNQNLTFSWLLPNGNTVNDPMLMLTANQVQSGIYTLKITDEFNCPFEITDTVTIAIGETFKSNFLTGQTACAGDTLHFIEISESDPNASTTYKWNFGDGGQSSDRDPVYTYARSGLFSVKLEVINKECENISLAKELNILACRKTYFDQFNVFPNPNSGVFTLELILFQEDNVLIEVFNRYGQKVDARILREVSYIRERFEQEETGLYFVTIRSLQGQITETVKVFVE